MNEEDVKKTPGESDTAPAAGADPSSGARQRSRIDIFANDEIYRAEIEFLKAFAHNTDSAGLYAINLNLMPSNFQSSLVTRFLYTAFFTLYNENKTLNYKSADDFLRGQAYLGKSQIEIVGHVLEEIFNLTGVAGARPVETDIKSLIYRIKENSFKNESRKTLAAAINRLNNEKGDYVNTIKKCSEALVGLLESSNLCAEGNYAVDVAALNIETELNALKNSRPFPGLSCGFDIMNQHLNGIENELYLIGGASAMGKTTFVTQMAFQLLKHNPDLNLVFFSLDQSQKDILIKFISCASGVPVKYIKCPFPKNEAHESKKKEGISYVTSLSKRMVIIDESRGEVNIKDFKNLVRKYRLEYFNRPLVVIVDSLSDIKPCQRFNDKISEITEIIAEFKTLIRTENFSMLATFNLDSGAEVGRPRREDIARVPAFIYQPYVTMTIYSDFIINYETPFLEWDWGGADSMVPITEVDIVKNKMNGFKGRIFYRYLDSQATFRECVEAENENYRAMIENIEHYQTKRGNQPLIPLAPTPPPMPNIKIKNNLKPPDPNEPRPKLPPGEEDII